MNPIKLLIADDDEGMRLVMRKIVERAEGFELVGQASDGEEMLKLFRALRPEVVVIDVEMPAMNGVECARVIQDENPKTVIIFATAHEQYMGEAFSVYAFDYLLKPFKVERALKTLSMVRERLRAPQQGEPAPAAPAHRAQAPARLMLRHREGVSFIDLDELMLIQREDRATVLYTSDGTRYVTSDSLSELEERLPAGMFFRTHKSYIVNVNHIDSITPYGRWTYVIRLRGTKQDALITHERFEALQQMFA